MLQKLNLFHMTVEITHKKKEIGIDVKIDGFAFDKDAVILIFQNIVLVLS